MFSGRKEDKPRRARRGGNLAMLGLMDVPDLDSPSDGEGDAALEAELLALTGGGGTQPPKRKGKAVVSPDQLAQMVSNCMRDNDDDEALDENDPDLLAELSALNQEDARESKETTPSRPAPAAPRREASDYRNPEPFLPRQAPMAAGKSVLELITERIAMYEAAEAEAKAGGESSRARRFNRGLKTLMQMQKNAKAGKPINEDEIPPPVVVRGVDRTPRDATPAAPQPVEDALPAAPVHNKGVAPVSIPHSVAFSEQSRVSPQPQPSSQKEPQDPHTASPAPQQPKQPAEPPPPLQRTSSISSAPSGPAATIRQLHTQYKTAALLAKRAGNKDQAIQYMRTMKQMEPMLKAAESGQPVDLTTLPNPPGQAPSSQPPPRETLSDTITPTHQFAGSGTESLKAAGEAGSKAEAAPAPGDPACPASVLEALQQRLAKYTEQRDKARAEENARKERMNQRIMKQYEDAIKKHKAGKPVDFDELPSPPGFAPIPVGGSSAPPVTATPASAAGESTTGGPPPPKQPRPAPSVPSTDAKPAAPPKNVRQAPLSRVEKQMALLTRRQTQFKQAALEAKKRGEIEQAKEYLRMSKGFDQLIEATRNGLPVDMNTLPVPPQEKVPQSSSTDFELVSADDCVVAPEGTSGDVALTYTKLEEDLIAQIKMCAETREHFKATGDVASSNRFEQLILHTKKDLDAVRAAFKRGNTPPRFHYENRSFNIIQCNTDINDSDCEVNILRGINFNVQNPKEVDTYIRVEFPYPADNPPQDRSVVIKDTNNPEYNHKVVFSIDRKSRALARVFKRQAIKFQVFAKGGWFHRDTVLGSVKVPMVELETKCTLHDSFDLMDERKRMVGGKLEVKVRLRNPIVAKQLEKVTEKWLVIDGF
ncbi:coiled-coil and C2 domain-containing protein 1-like [Portunus trituberculatus]|uniref:coiled-coil and C2 domain-containing protein 1-like n=1 Tax=Portunus trituberculatus TaxID=210409 RepID=UPI001E1CC48F|nr:coiled-coil and C2 domain-containing protein 1-like [Portunus trituberculatus]